MKWMCKGSNQNWREKQRGWERENERDRERERILSELFVQETVKKKNQKTHRFWPDSEWLLCSEHCNEDHIYVHFFK